MCHGIQEFENMIEINKESAVTRKGVYFKG